MSVGYTPTQASRKRLAIRARLARLQTDAQLLLQIVPDHSVRIDLESARRAAAELEAIVERRTRT